MLFQKPNQNNMNHNLARSIYPAPAAPDFHECDKFYATAFKPIAADCDAAFNLLPQGADNITWSINSQHGEPWGLPYVVTYGQ